MIALTRPFLSPEAQAGLATCAKGHWLGYGPVCRELETAFLSPEKGAAWALATSSCTAALHLAAQLCRVSGEDEAIVPAVTFVSAAMAFACAGFKLRFADVEPRTGMVSVESVAAKITPRTRVVVAVHLYGQRAEIASLHELCQRHQLTLIEDCAHRLDLLDGEAQLSDYACFSFNAMKEIPCGEGGLLRARQAGGEEAARAISNAGLEVDPWQRSAAARHRDYGFSRHPGLKWRLNDVLASLVVPALPQLRAARARRQAIFRRYQEVLAPLGPRLEPLRGASEHDSCLMFVARLAPGIDRECVRAELAAAGMASSVHYPALTRHPMLSQCGNACPDAEAFDQRILTLPCHLQLSDAEVEEVGAALASALRPRVSTPAHPLPPTEGVVLYGEQVEIGWPRPDEFDAITALRNSPRVRRWFVDSRPLDPLANRRWLASGMNRPREALLSIRAKGTGVFLGVCGWSDLDAPAGSIVLGRFGLDLDAVRAFQDELAPDYRGVALDTALSVRDWVFGELKLRLVRSSYLVQNRLAARINRAMGLTPIGRGTHAGPDGRPLDLIHLELRRERWEQLVKEILHATGQQH